MRHQSRSFSFSLAALVLSATVSLSGCSSIESLLGSAGNGFTKAQTSSPTPTPLLVSDARGSYKRDTSANVENFPWGSVATGNEDIEILQKWVVDFVFIEGLDSIALDDASMWKTWKETVAAKYIAPEHLSALLNKKDGAIILADGAPSSNRDSLPDLMRTGESRWLSKKFTNGTIRTSNEFDGGKRIYTVELYGVAQALVEEDPFGQWELTNSDWNGDGPMPQMVIDAYKNHELPFFDGNPETIEVQFSLSMKVKEVAGAWYFIDSDNRWGVGTP